MKYIMLLVVLLIGGLNNDVISQTIPVGLLKNVEDVYRRDQLLGKDSSNSSFMVRPLFIQQESEYSLRLLPVVLQQQFDRLPYGSNDGPFIPAKGYQGYLSAGFFAALGPVSIQLRPEFIYAVNKKFDSILATDNAADFVSSYSRLMGSIDLPERFGEGAYRKAYLGQSSIRVTKSDLSFGLSNENLWWGPGVRNSLLMSNNAPGFLHFTFNTVKPLQTGIGSFEGQLITGWLKSSGIPLPEQLNLAPKPVGDRRINGLVVTYQPKWIKGLYLGVDHTSVKNKSKLEMEWPAAGTYVSNMNKGQDDDNYTSLFARWVMPESKAEFYIQYGTKKFNYELPGAKSTDPAIAGADRMRAYIAGFSKLIGLNRADDEFIKIGAEITEMGNQNPRKLYPWPSWYNSYVVRDGYTNRGQLLGAAVGPGGNMQSMDVSWVKGFKRIGFQVERMVHNNDMFYTMKPYTADIRRNWVDLVIGGKIDWDLGPILLNSELTYIRSFNYQWQFSRPGEAYKNKDYWDWDKKDMQNIQAKLGVMYRF